MSVANAALLGGLCGFSVYLALGLFLAEVAIKHDRRQALQDWIDAAPRFARVSVLGWLQVSMTIGGALAGIGFGGR